MVLNGCAILWAIYIFFGLVRFTNRFYDSIGRESAGARSEIAAFYKEAHDSIKSGYDKIQADIERASVVTAESAKLFAENTERVKEANDMIAKLKEVTRRSVLAAFRNKRPVDKLISAAVEHYGPNEVFTRESLASRAGVALSAVHGWFNAAYALEVQYKSKVFLETTPGAYIVDDLTYMILKESGNVESGVEGGGGGCAGVNETDARLSLDIAGVSSRNEEDS